MFPIIKLNCNDMRKIGFPFGRGAAATLLCLFLCMGVGKAQADEKDFGDALLKVMTLSGQGNKFDEAKVKMLPALQSVNRSVLAQESMAKGDGLAAKFLEDSLMSVMIKPMFMEMFEGKITAAELVRISDMLETAEGRTYTAHFNATAQKMDDLPEKLMVELGRDFTGMRQMEYTCPEEYAGKYAAFYKNSILQKVIGSVKDMLGQMVTSVGGGEEAEALNVAIGFLEKNMGVMMANAAYGTMTEADLDFGIRLNGTPEYRKFIAALDLTKMSQGAAQTGTGLVEAYTGWLGKQEGVVLKKR